MCGILGIYNYGNAAVPVTSDLLVRLRDTMQHRGPDDAGWWARRDGKVGLAHRRLSIVDLSADGRQPMANEDGTVLVTFNGEIYNHRDLRKPLERQGHRFRSRSDTEAIVHLYEEYGSACVHHLDGMFAFGIWDEGRQALFLARDRLGVKPLYYTQQRGVLLFASEIKALLAHPLIAADLDLEALHHYLTFKTTPAPLTMFAGIRKLPAGCCLTCDRHGHAETARYWDPVSPPQGRPEAGDEKAAAARVRTLLTESVTKRLMADVPTGVFLSGGLDSSAVVALLAPQLSRPLNTFSVGIKDVEEEDELGYARLVARHFATNHQEILIGRKDLEEYLPELVYHQDEPLADPVCVPLFYLSRLARRCGTVVVQAGEGSDELFFGYDSRLHFLKSYHRKWRPLLALPGWVVRGLHAGFSCLHRATGWGSRWQHVLGKAARGDELFWGSVAFGEPEKDQVLTAWAGGAHSSQVALQEALRPLHEARPSADFATRVAYLDLKVRLAELLLMRTDKVTMSQGVEAREPFLDYRLVEYLMAVPWSWKLRGWQPKYLLKRALAGLLPEEILRRPKKAFAAPVGSWLRAGLGAFAAQVIFGSRLKERGLFQYDRVRQLLEDHVEGRRDHGVKIWTLMNLSAWYDRWVAGGTAGLAPGAVAGAAAGLPESVIAE